MEGSPDRTDAIYSIGAVARMLGVPAQTLRAWRVGTNRSCLLEAVGAAALQLRPGGSAQFHPRSDRSRACNRPTLTGSWPRKQE